MAEQFSQEYIVFILSDEAKGLQEKWEPKVGHWCWNGMEIGILTGIPRPEKNWLVGVLRKHYWEQGKWSMETFGKYQLTWLPTLWDLLQIIEGAGWEWAMSWSKLGIWGTIMRPDESVWDSTREREKTMLAAAKLAVRALVKGG